MEKKICPRCGKKMVRLTEKRPNGLSFWKCDNCLKIEEITEVKQEPDTIVCPFCGGVMPKKQWRSVYPFTKEGYYYECSHCEYDIAVGYAENYKK